MILNYDFVHISSPSGMTDIGEFNNLGTLIKALEQLRKDNKLVTDNHMCLMTVFKNSKTRGSQKMGVFRIAYLEGRWSLLLS